MVEQTTPYGATHCAKCNKPFNATGLMEMCLCPSKNVNPNSILTNAWQKAHTEVETKKQVGTSLAVLYPAYYKDVSHISEIDVYMVHYLFNIIDPSGAIQHASKKLLLSGARTGGKSMFKDIKEARDTLNRWLEMNPEK